MSNATSNKGPQKRKPSAATNARPATRVLITENLIYSLQRRFMKRAFFAAWLLLAPLLSHAGILFTYNCVNTATGAITILRLDDLGGYEVIEATSKDSRAAILTNHVAGAGVDMGPFLSEVKRLAHEEWLVGGKPIAQVRSHTAMNGDSVTMLLITYSGAFAEMRPVSAYTNLVQRCGDLIKNLSQTGQKCGRNDGILITSSYVGNFDDKPLTVTDPYALVALPQLNRVFTDAEYDRMRKEGQLDKISIYSKGKDTPITAAISLTTRDGKTLLQDVK